MTDEERTFQTETLLRELEELREREWVIFHRKREIERELYRLRGWQCKACGAWMRGDSSWTSCTECHEGRF